MTGKKTTPEEAERSALIKAGCEARAQAIAEAADQRVGRIKQERDASGRMLAKVTPDQWEWFLERLEAGDLIANLVRHLGVTQATVNCKRMRDAEFDRLYRIAVENAYVNIAHDIRAVTRGEPGYSTGDVRRDELVAKYDLELAKRFAPRTLGDKFQVDQRVFQLVVRPGDADL